MEPGRLNLVVYKGSTFVKSIQWKSGDPPVAVNLTGYTARMQIRKRVNDTVILESLTTENSKIVFTDAVNGILELRISAAVSTAYTFCNAVYDLELVNPDGVTVYRILEGSFTAAPEVTR